MTSIGSNSFSFPTSPRAQMNDRIAAATSAGTISAADQTALGSALDSIDSMLDAGKADGASGSGGSIKDKVNSLIDKQVSAGTLTSDQATELKSFFAEGAKGKGGNGGPHGPGGHGGPPPSDDSSSDDSTSSTSSTSSTDSTDQLSSLMEMLEKLRSGLTSTTTYGGGTSSASSDTSGLIVNTLA